MKAYELGDLFLPEEILMALIIGDNVRELELLVVAPAMPRIERTVGAKIDTRYMAHMLRAALVLGALDAYCDADPNAN